MSRCRQKVIKEVICLLRKYSAQWRKNRSSKGEKSSSKFPEALLKKLQEFILQTALDNCSPPLFDDNIKKLELFLNKTKLTSLRENCKSHLGKEQDYTTVCFMPVTKVMGSKGLPSCGQCSKQVQTKRLRVTFEGYDRQEEDEEKQERELCRSLKELRGMVEVLEMLEELDRERRFLNVFGNRLRIWEIEQDLEEALASKRRLEISALLTLLSTPFCHSDFDSLLKGFAECCGDEMALNQKVSFYVYNNDDQPEEIREQASEEKLSSVDWIFRPEKCQANASDKQPNSFGFTDQFRSNGSGKY